MRSPLTLVFALFLLCGCDSYQIKETYRFYDSYSRPGRDFKRVVACLPHDPSKIMISNVETVEYDSKAIHLLCTEEGIADQYILILPNARGFDCTDETKTPAMNRTEYEVFCSSNGYPILLTKQGQ